MGSSISTTNQGQELQGDAPTNGVNRTTIAAEPVTDSPVVTRFVPRWNGIPQQQPAAVVPVVEERIPARMPSFASDNNLLVVTTPRQPKKKKALFIDYTPMNVVEKEDYKFYCQFCCMYFREILQTACCNHYSCYACSLTYCAGRCGLKSSLSGIPRELPAAMPCLACSKEGLTLAYVSFHEKVRSYADSPATRRAMEDAERAKRKAEGGLPTIDGSPNLAPCRDAEGEGGAAADEATPGKALSFDAIELGGGGRRRGDDGASPTGVDSGVSSAATSVSTSPAPSDGGDPGSPPWPSRWRTPSSA